MGTGTETASEGGLLRRAIRRISASDEQIEAVSLQSQCSSMGATPIDQTQDREIVHIAGTVRSVTLRPVGGVPALEADVYDGSGAVTVIFLGRRKVAGIKPGATLSVRGRLSRKLATATIYNPAYTLHGGKHS